MWDFILFIESLLQVIRDNDNDEYWRAQVCVVPELFQVIYTNLEQLPDLVYQEIHTPSIE
jgi:hypothetical protein